MIYTVTLNPSVDYVVRLEKLVSGITNRSEREEVSFGGKGINVSLVLAELGLKSTALGFVAGFTGEAIAESLQNEFVTADFIRLPRGISRINVKIKAGEETEINGQGPHIEEEDLAKLMQKLDRTENGDTLILSGSIPNTLPNDTYQRILDRVRIKPLRIVVDATGGLLMKTLPYRPFLIKPNRQELSELLGVPVKTPEETLEGAKRLQALGARNVLVSLGKEGAMLLDETGEVRRIGIVSNEVVNTVGAGDSMVAGFVAGYLQTGDYGYALRLGSACGNATASLPGLATRARIEEILPCF